MLPPPDKLSAEVNAAASIPLTIRLSHRIPEPNDWQDFQRKCVILYREELGDPHVVEYGRNGQKQYGIDIRGTRNQDPEHQVGVQCRKYGSPLKYAAVLADCRSAIGHFPKMREFIFATTSPDDAKATDVADRVEQLLRSEGHEIRVVLYGWNQLQQRIAHHPAAYAAFFPYAQSSSAPQAFNPVASPPEDLIEAAVARALQRTLRPGLLAGTPATEPSSRDRADEDPALHARIDGFRDAFAKDWLIAYAERGLLELEKTPDLDKKPWGKFRIESNLASLAFAQGHESEALVRFEAAYQILPNDAVAIANLALARMMQDKFDEAFLLAQQALEVTPRSDQAVCYLLQAAARSGWEGDPETLIPPDLAGSVHADLGLAEFGRRREPPGWQQRSIEIANRHPDVADFKPTHAIAVLSLALESGTVMVGGLGPVSGADLTAAADEMKIWVERMLDLGIGTEYDQRAHLNNACVLLRLCSRNEEVEQLLTRARELVHGDSLLKRLLAIAQIALGKKKDAISTLHGDLDSENRLFHAELIAQDDLGGGLEQAKAVQTADLPSRLRSLRAQMIAELAMRLDHEHEFRQAILELRALEPDEPIADLLELRDKKRRGLSTEDYQEALKKLASNISTAASVSGRTLLATELQDADCPAEASFLLEGRVDLTRITATSIFYLQTLAASRRDEAFQRAVTDASEALRDHPQVLWLRSAHAWNAGDLDLALRSVIRLLDLQPENARARILKIEVLLRQNVSSGVISELEQPVEELPTLNLSGSFRLASLLWHFGFTGRASDFAYRLLLENRENPRAWMTLAGIVFANSGGTAAKSAWDVSVVGPNVAVDLAFDTGSTLFFVVEPEQQLRKLDSKSWEPNHPTVKAIAGLASGDCFVDSTGQTGTITSLRHKIVARFHEVLAEYETRFPGQNDLQTMSLNPGQPGGLDHLKDKLKERWDWVQQEQEQWVNSHWPLGLLALRLHMDILDVASGIAAQGIKLKVALGNDMETGAAIAAITSNKRQGCVLDLHSFWTNWRLKTLANIEAVCGTVHVSRSVVDRLRTRQERLHSPVQGGQTSARYDNGQIAVVATPPDIVQGWGEDLDQAVSWLENNAEICPVIITDNLPPVLREHMTIGPSDIYDALTLSMQKRILLVSDDLRLREHGHVLGFDRSCWTQVALRTALGSRKIGAEAYARSVGQLLDAGHNYIGVSGNELAFALLLDAEEGIGPGKLFQCLAETIGGKDAEPSSHAIAVVTFLLIVSRSSELRLHWKRAASLILRNLLRWRHDDYIQIFRAVMSGSRGDTDVLEFLLYWAKGHFIPLSRLMTP